MLAKAVLYEKIHFLDNRIFRISVYILKNADIIERKTIKIKGEKVWLRMALFYD
jgi:hypothetical protein